MGFDQPRNGEGSFRRSAIQLQWGSNTSLKESLDESNAQNRIKVFSSFFGLSYIDQSCAQARVSETFLCLISSGQSTSFSGKS
jgi:hypothetical protein